MTTREMFVYPLGPIDYWDGWTLASQYHFRNGDGYSRADFERDFAQAQELARKLGWEGDIRDGPYLSGIPGGEAFPAGPCVIIGWKQDNNGSTFVASPVRLRHLEPHGGKIPVLRFNDPSGDFY